jgi:hypothetical protein
MMVSTDKRSLYEDWLLRRDRVAHDTEGIEQYRRIQLQLLDYLIERYRDAPEVRRPARFPLPTVVYVNERAMLVHNHLWRGQTSGTKNRFEVKNRVSAIVERMRAAAPGTEDAEFGAATSELPEERTAALDSSTEGLPGPSDEEQTLWWRLRSAWSSVLWQFNLLFGLRRQVAPGKLRRLFRICANPKRHDVWLLFRLLDCGHSNVPRYAFQAWLDRIRGGCNDDISRHLQRSFGTLDEGQLDSIRALLAHVSADVRIVVIEMLAARGTLDDVSLLCDLLNLPQQADEHPRERATLGLAAKQIAERHSGK